MYLDVYILGLVLWEEHVDWLKCLLKGEDNMGYLTGWRMVF